jgi:hypothetical protein
MKSKAEVYAQSKSSILSTASFCELKSKYPPLFLTTSDRLKVEVIDLFNRINVVLHSFGDTRFSWLNYIMDYENMLLR